MDIVGQVLQRKQSDILIDTSDPVITKAEQKKVNQTNAQLELQKQIEIELPKEIKPAPDVIITPVKETPPSYSGGGGGGSYYKTMPGRLNNNQFDGPILQQNYQ